MSFTSDVKNELLRVENESGCCEKTELCAMLCFCGSVFYEGDALKLKMTTESAAAARKCFMLMKNVFGITGGIDTKKSRAGRGGYCYTIIAGDSMTVQRILEGLGLYDDEYKRHVTFKAASSIKDKPCCRRAFVRGAFLGGGSITNPEKGYHLEFVTHYANLSRGLEQILQSFSLAAKTIKRKSSYVTYIKNGDEISDVLSLIGAHKAMMDFANVRIIKDTRNDVNRKVNCETANMDKTISAAFTQLDAIKRLKREGRLDALPLELREIAQLRLENKEASLKEIAELAALTKSGANHRLKRLVSIADRI